jgi:hypothetical protein
MGARSGQYRDRYYNESKFESDFAQFIDIVQSVLTNRQNLF